MSRRAESTVCETEQQSTLTEKNFYSSPWAPRYSLSRLPSPPDFLCFLFLLFPSPPAIPRLVFLSGLKGMLSGPITQEAGITETSAREEEEGRGREAGTRRQLRGGRKELAVECVSGGGVN